MTTANLAPSAAKSDVTRVPTLEQAARELRLHGAGAMAEWQALLGPLAVQVRAQDQAVAAWRKSAKRKQVVAAAIAAVAALCLGLAGVFVIGLAAIILGVAVALAGIFAARLFIKMPDANFTGTERIDFVRGLVDAIAAVAPDGRLRLAAQLDSGRSVPEVAPPSQPGEARGEREDAWLRGSLQGIPGLRLSWQATEWRVVRMSQKVNPRGKTKFKAKYAYASRLVARIDADHALFALKSEPAPAGGPEGVIDARKTARGYTVRGWRERSAKTLLDSTDVGEALGGLREKGAQEWFGEPASALLALMRLCEERLVLRGAKEGT